MIEDFFSLEITPVIMYNMSIFTLYFVFMECNYCKSEVADGAIKCKSCWEFIDKKYKSNNSLLHRNMFQWAVKIYCPNCEFEWKTSKTMQKWSGFITLLLLFLWLIPWLIYASRRGKEHYVCPKCKNANINSIT